MGTGIPYCDEVWNVCVGCTKIKSGCQNCWAERLHNQRHTAWWDHRWPAAPRQYHKPFSDMQLISEMLNIPLHWRKPRTIFVNSMSDTFHEDVPFEFIDKIFAVASVREKHKYLFFTKRWKRALDYFSGDYKERVGVAALKYISPLLAEEAQAYWREPFLPNVHLYFSASTQAEVDEAGPILLDIPVAGRGFSLEPLLGPINISPYIKSGGLSYKILSQYYGPGGFDESGGQQQRTKPRLQSIIVGCESGPNRRLCDIEDIKSVADQCKSSGVPCYVKQIPIAGGCATLTEKTKSIWPAWAGREMPK